MEVCKKMIGEFKSTSCNNDYNRYLIDFLFEKFNWIFMRMQINIKGKSFYSRVTINLNPYLSCRFFSF